MSRGSNDPDAIRGGIQRLLKMLLEFPGPVALKAIDQWPREDSGKFFPTEAELYALAKVIARENVARADRAIAAQTTGEGRYSNPFEATARYVDKVARVRGDSYVRSWLVGGINCQFTHDTVYLTGAGYDRLSADTWHAAKEFGVKLRACPQVSKKLADHCERLEADGLVKPKKKGRSWGNDE